MYTLKTQRPLHYIRPPILPDSDPQAPFTMASDDERSTRSGMSTRSQSSRRSGGEAPKRGGYVQCQVQMCRAFFVLKDTSYICFNTLGTKCGRTGHTKAEKCRNIGWYYLTHETRRPNLDGIEGTGIPEAEYDSREATLKAADAAALKAMPAGNPPIPASVKSLTSPTAKPAFIPMPKGKGGRLSFGGEEEVPDLAHTFTDETEGEYGTPKGDQPSPEEVYNAEAERELIRKWEAEEAAFLAAEEKALAQRAEARRKHEEALRAEATRQAMAARERARSNASREDDEFLQRRTREAAAIPKQEKERELYEQRKQGRASGMKQSAQEQARAELKAIREEAERLFQARRKELEEARREEAREAARQELLQEEVAALWATYQRENPAQTSTKQPSPAPRPGARSVPHPGKGGEDRTSLPKVEEADPARRWFGFVKGRLNKYGVVKTARGLEEHISDTMVVATRPSEEEAWEWVLANRDGLQPPVSEDLPAKEPERMIRNPAGPPSILAGKDKSTKNPDEIFEVPINVDGEELAVSFAPDSVSKEVAKTLSNTLLDVASLPGKTYLTDRDDVTGEIRDSLFVVMSQQQSKGDGPPPDLKWHQPSKNAVMACKDEEDLRELKRNVIDVQAQHLRRGKEQQRVLLLKNGFDDIMAHAWSNDGFYTTLNQRGVQYYVDFLDHVIQLCSTQGWEAARVVIEHYTKKWKVIRGNNDSRLVALCQIYVTLRDGHHAGWLHLKLTDKKVNALVVQLQGRQGATTTTPPSATNGTVGWCRKCETVLHGSKGCPWSDQSGADAKKAGKEVLRRLAAGDVISRG